MPGCRLPTSIRRALRSNPRDLQIRALRRMRSNRRDLRSRVYLRTPSVRRMRRLGALLHRHRWCPQRRRSNQLTCSTRCSSGRVSLSLVDNSRRTRRYSQSQTRRTMTFAGARMHVVHGARALRTKDPPVMRSVRSLPAMGVIRFHRSSQATVARWPVVRSDDVVGPSGLPSGADSCWSNDPDGSVINATEHRWPITKRPSSCNAACPRRAERNVDGRPSSCRIAEASAGQTASSVTAPAADGGARRGRGYRCSWRGPFAAQRADLNAPGMRYQLARALAISAAARRAAAIAARRTVSRPRQ
jgi:hypothetical protein